MRVPGLAPQPHTSQLPEQTPHKLFPRLSQLKRRFVSCSWSTARSSEAAPMMHMSSSTPTEVDRLYPESPLATKIDRSHFNHQQPDRCWLRLRALLGVGLVVGATALALFAAHEQTLVTPQSLFSIRHTPINKGADSHLDDDGLSLRDSFFQAFELAPSQAEPLPPAPAPPSSASGYRKKWNWLSPSGPSFNAMKESNKEVVTVSAVYKHMLDQRHAQVADAVSDLLHAELNYNLTLTCFNEAITEVQKFELTETEFTDLIGWMDVNCYDPSPDSGAESLSDTTSTTDSSTIAAAHLVHKKSKKNSGESRRASLNVEGVRARSAHHQAVRNRGD